MYFHSAEALAAYCATRPTLTHLELHRWTQPTLPSLPDSVRYLVLSDCPNLTSIEKWPDQLEDLRMRDCPSIEELPNFPATLKHVRLDIFPSLKRLPEWPKSIIQVAIFDAETLYTVPLLPESTESFSLHNCANVSHLPGKRQSASIYSENVAPVDPTVELPASLKQLQISKCARVVGDELKVKVGQLTITIQ